MEYFDLGSRHVIWIKPCYEDIVAEVVAFNKKGHPIMKTLEGERSVLLEPQEYILPTIEECEIVSAAKRTFREVHGEDL